MFCQAAFSDKHIVRHYPFENMCTKLRGSGEGMIIPEFTSVFTHSIMIFRSARGTHPPIYPVAEVPIPSFPKRGKAFPGFLGLFS